MTTQRATQRTLRRGVAAAGVLLLTLLGGVPAAHAHDEVTGTLPAAGAVVATMPAAVTISLTGTPAAVGAEINVLDAAGKNWSTGATTVLDRTATQPVTAGAPDGVYTVDWRLVSSDGHPVEKSFSFTVGSTTGAGAGPAQPIQEVSPAAVEQVPDGGVPWSVIGLGGVLALLLVALLVVAKRRLGAAED